MSSPAGMTIRVNGQPGTLDDVRASAAAMTEPRRAALVRVLDQIAAALPAFSELADQTGGPVVFSVGPSGAELAAVGPSGEVAHV